MYERFTDRARTVMQLANQEAQRFNHEYVGTEHVLLGLVKEGAGVAANVLKNLDIDLRKIRLEVEKIVQHGPGGEQILIGRLPHTPTTKKVIEQAVEEAKTLSHNYVGTEHILLGLCSEKIDPVTVGRKVLASLGVTADLVRREVLTLLGFHCEKEGEPVGQEEEVATPFELRIQDHLNRILGVLQLELPEVGGEVLKRVAKSVAANLFEQPKPPVFGVPMLASTYRAWKMIQAVRDFNEGLLRRSAPEPYTPPKPDPLEEVMTVWGSSVVDLAAVKLPSADSGFTSKTVHDWGSFAAAITAAKIEPLTVVIPEVASADLEGAITISAPSLADDSLKCWDAGIRDKLSVNPGSGAITIPGAVLPFPTQPPDDEDPSPIIVQQPE